MKSQCVVSYLKPQIRLR